MLRVRAHDHAGPDRPLAEGEIPEVEVVYLGAYSEVASDYDRLRTEFDTYRGELTDCYLQALLDQDESIDDRWDTGSLSLIVVVDDEGCRRFR